MIFLADTVLSNMLNFVGGGHYIFIGGVNRRWRTLYATIAKDKDGNLVTKYSTAKASVSTLEFAVACDLDLATDAFELSSGEYGPGVYECARENGFPLLVWVAMETYPEMDDGEILGVYSSAEVAKLTAAEKYGLDVGDWEGSLKFSTLEVRNASKLRVVGSAVEDVDYSMEVELKNRLPMYVVIRIGMGSEIGFNIEGVFGTKEAANRKVDEGIARTRAHPPPALGDEGRELRVRTHKGLKKGCKDTTVWGPWGNTTVKVDWGKFLDAA